VPYRIDVRDPPHDALDTLIGLGALDVEPVGDGLAAIVPDGVSPAAIAHALGVADLRVRQAVGHDDESVWTVCPRPVRTRTFLIVPAGAPASPGALRLADSPAFGTGLHPTTALCLEAIDDLLDVSNPSRVLDVGTGSGILALAALWRGVRTAVALDIDAGALGVAAANARLNDVAGRLLLARGGPDVIGAAFPLVLANIRAAELMEMAPTLTRRVSSGGQLVMSGVPQAVAGDVERTYRRLGMIPLRQCARDGWTALVLSPSW
jgi:ribosomal protein L11 methyltransferase